VDVKRHVTLFTLVDGFQTLLGGGVALFAVFTVRLSSFVEDPDDEMVVPVKAGVVIDREGVAPGRR
jgi:hypothetical protein